MKLLFVFLAGFAFADGNAQYKTCPAVVLEIAFPKTTFSGAEDIPVTMTLINHTDTVQGLWFTTPRISTGGPAWTTVSLINKQTGKSVLKYSNKAVLSSQAYSVEEVHKKQNSLKPKEHISSTFSLYNLAVIEGDNFRLEKGVYEIQLFYCGNPSNVVTLTIN